MCQKEMEHGLLLTQLQKLNCIYLFFGHLGEAGQAVNTTLDKSITLEVQVVMGQRKLKEIGIKTDTKSSKE